MTLSISSPVTYSSLAPLLKESLERVRILMIAVIQEKLCDVKASLDLVQNASQYFSLCFNHNVSDGKMTRGLTVPLVYRSLLEGDCCENDFQNVVDIGCCMEILQASFLVLDDIMDKSQVRRGKPCWYKVGGVGAGNAINDGMFLESLVYALLERLVPAKSRRVVLCLVQDTVFRTILGQHLDCVNSFDSTRNSTYLSVEAYKSTIRSKTSFYSFWLPVAVGIILSNRVSEEDPDFETTRNICIKLGEYFQIQDDFLDSFGNPEILGKVGTDIEEGKRTWLAVNAYKLCSSDDEKEWFLKTLSFPSRTKENVLDIRLFYKKLRLEELFHVEEVDMIQDIHTRIGKVGNEKLRDCLFSLLGRISNRRR